MDDTEYLFNTVTLHIILSDVQGLYRSDEPWLDCPLCLYKVAPPVAEHNTNSIKS